MGTAAELTLTSNGLQAPTGGKVPAEVAAAAASGETRRRPPRQVAPKPDAKTAALHAEQHERNAAADAETVDMESVPDEEKPREDIESVEVKLPDGRDVVFGPPSGVSLTARVAMLMAGQPPSDAMDLIARCCLSVRLLDGKKLPPITNRVDIQKCANIIGDAGLDVMAYLLSEHWPAVKLKELQTIKKNLRGS